MNDSMMVAVMNTPGRFDFEKRSVPEIGTKDVLIRVNYVGVCGSDTTLFENGYIGDSVVNEPMVLGHEASGTVVEVGAEVQTLSRGDRVAMEPGVPCGECDFCREGKYNLCPDVYFWASLPVVEGALQEYVRHPAANCFKLPVGVSLLEGALVEPLAVAMHAVRSSGAGLGDSAVVFGAGCVGLLTMLSLRAAGLAKVLVVDLVSNRLEVARGLGAEIHNAADGSMLPETVSELFGVGPGFAFETAGSQVSMDQAIAVVRRGGTITFVGYTKDGRADLNVNLLIDKELSVKSVFRYRNVYPHAIAAIEAGTIPVERVVSRVYSFAEANLAMNDAIHRKHDVTKCVISVSPES